ncbi:hypothetical protein vseg_007710 [Gypsophila vaccaria]
MAKIETSQQQQQTMDNVPPAGYPTLTPPEGKTKKKGIFRTKQRGEKGFIEGCLAALCCCFICEECCC